MVELGNETRQLTEKEMFKLYKMQIQRSQFLEYLLRQVATVTYRYNCFEMSPQLAEFAQSMAEAEVVRSQMKLKKNEQPQITSFKIMLETCNRMTELGMLEHANRLRDFLDMSGRLRVVSGQAAEFVKILEKSGADSNYTDKSLFLVKQWKGFCLRGFDYSALPVLNADTVTVVTTEDSDQRLPDDDQSQAVYESEPEVKQQTSEKELQELNQKAEQIRQLVLRYLPWPAAVRTALYAACQYLRRVSLASNIRLFPADPTEFRKFLQGPELVTAFNIDEYLFNRVAGRRFSAVLGVTDDVPAVKLPKLPAIDPARMKCVRDTGIIFELPNEPLIEPRKRTKKSEKATKVSGKR